MQCSEPYKQLYEDVIKPVTTDLGLSPAHGDDGHGQRDALPRDVDLDGVRMAGSEVLR